MPHVLQLIPMMTSLPIHSCKTVAVIKYWGKNDVKLNTPLNSSVSVTLDQVCVFRACTVLSLVGDLTLRGCLCVWQTDLHTITTVAASKDFPVDRLWLNEAEIEINGRGLTCLREIRKLARDRVDPATGAVLVAKEDWPQYHVHISSVNTFPTGAGLASSAAGFACLVAALAQLYNVQEEFPGQISSIARQGSGSASRSLYGGFVRWQKGERADGTDSIAVQVADEHVRWV
jgi:diphosphomevalonate decarboxylase